VYVSENPFSLMGASESEKTLVDPVETLALNRTVRNMVTDVTVRLYFTCLCCAKYPNRSPSRRISRQAENRGDGGRGKGFLAGTKNRAGSVAIEQLHRLKYPTRS
jgi:hypothetical protein